MDKGPENLKHALANDCEDPDCEIHNPDVGIREGTVSLTNLAFFVAGACKAGKAIQEGIECSIEDTVNEDFRFYHEEALNIVESQKLPPGKPDPRD